MESGDGEDGMLKVDSLGRVKRTAEQREALLEEFSRSGMSGKAFTHHYGISYTTFASWRQARDRRLRETDSRGGTLALTEVSVDRRSSGGEPLCVELPGGARMQIADEAGACLAAELIKGLRDTD
jgi:hypothetical protein